MGIVKVSNTQYAQQHNTQSIIEHTLSQLQPLHLNYHSKVTLQPFSPLNHTDRAEIMNISQGQILIRHQWGSLQEMQKYVSNLIKLYQMAKYNLYNEIILKTEENPYSSQLVLKEEGIPISTISNPVDQIELLIFISEILSKVQNVSIDPKCIYSNKNIYFLVDFFVSSISPKDLFLGFITWLQDPKKQFQACTRNHKEIFEEENRQIYFKQLYQQLEISSNIDFSEISKKLNTIKEKMIILENNIDSFHACTIYNKIKLSSKQWLVAKEDHMLYFYNTTDEHCCNCRIIRKNRTINIDERHIIFHSSELEVKYIPQNSKFMVKVGEFELEQHTSMSDIEIIHKFPIKFHDPMLLQLESGTIYILDQLVYKYTPSMNKLSQETKKISDYIYLAQSSTDKYIVVRMSIDILRNGIRILVNGNDVQLLIVGNQSTLREISSVRIDIKQVEFCLEAYNGVYIMLANKNIWILDLNFNCFFSYCPPSKIREFYNFNKTVDQSQFAFDILNQPFAVEFLKGHSNINASIIDKQLHIIGKIMGRFYFLKYQFLPNRGAIKLVEYKPIFAEHPTIMIPPIIQQPSNIKYTFNFHQEYGNLYKYEKWIFTHEMFIKIYNFNIEWYKSNYKVEVTIEPIEQSLKQTLEKRKKAARPLAREEVVLLLFKMLIFMENLLKMQITHRTFSISNIYTTRNKQLKLIGWSEPPRNWYVSDFKDYLLVCFNIITLNSYEKITEKILNKHEQQMRQYHAINQCLLASFKMAKTVEKKMQLEKSLSSIRDYLQKEISKSIEKTKENRYILSFEFNTPRFTIVDTDSQKIKKLVVENLSETEQFIFRRDDRYSWNQQRTVLYILTRDYKFYELQINMENFKQEKIKVEDYQYLPNNLHSNSIKFIYSKGLYSFGGIEKKQKGNNVFCKNVYIFNRQKLCWEVDGEIQQKLISPYIIVSNNSVFLIGGQVDQQSQNFKVTIYDIQSKTSKFLIDYNIINPIKSLHYRNPVKVCYVSEVYNAFAIWYLNGGFYNVKYIACVKGGFEILLQTKHYIDDKQDISQLSVSLRQKTFHVLRLYGKYTKINVNKMSSLEVHNQTLYSI